MRLINQLIQTYPKNITLNYSLAKLSYLKIGGTAKYFIKVASKEMLEKVIATLQQAEQDYCFIGKASNVLINDEDLDLAVIMGSSAEPQLIDEDIIEFSSITPNQKAIAFAHKKNLYGLEFLTGIPGSLGGAVVMNAGIPGEEIKDYLHSVEIFRENKFHSLPAQELELKYRSSNVLKKEFIYNVRVKLKKGTYETIKKMKKKCQEILSSRKAKQPGDQATLGSTFKNPLPEHAGSLIEKLGLKGLSVGGISISNKHANFLLNDGSGTANDALALIKLIQKKTLQEKNIFLEKEIRLLGFK